MTTTRAVHVTRRNLLAICASAGTISISLVGLVLVAPSWMLNATPWLLGALASGLVSVAVGVWLAGTLGQDLMSAVAQIGNRSAHLDSRISQLDQRLGETSNATTRRLDDLSQASRDLKVMIRETERKLIKHVQIVESVTRDLALSGRTAATREDLLEESRRIYLQVEGLISMYTSLRPDVPLPPFGGWAISSDLAAHLIRLVYQEAPELVVEAGSGLSTAMLSLAMRRTGRGRVVALEHDEHYCEVTEDLLKLHGLESTAEVVYAPLVPTAVGEEIWSWYDLSKSGLAEGEINLLFVDGPPGPTGHLARYPALPVLEPYLAPDVVIVLDDADRPDELELLNRWDAEVPGLVITRFGYDKGAVEIRR